MANFSFWTVFGLCLLKLCLAETEFNVSCRYGGVFHVEKNGRYSLTRSEAVELCRALNSTLATLEQLKKAHELGFETCRYGFVVGHIVIPRINPYHLCAANKTGIYRLPANTTARYDAYCYNATETEEKTCEPVVKIDTSLLSNQDETVIDNADGSRYNPDGTRHTGGESSTSGLDDENAGSGSIHETTPMDASITRSSPSYYGSPTPVSQLPDHSSGGGEKGIPEKDYDDGFPSTSPDITSRMVAGDFHEGDDGQYPASTTPGPHHDSLEKTTTQAWWNPFPDNWWWSNPGEKTQEPTAATRAGVTSSGSDSDDEDSSEEVVHLTMFPGWGRSVAKEETALSTTPGPHHDSLEKTTTQAWWNPFPDNWWWSNPGEKTQEPTAATRAGVTSSGSDSDDEDSSEEVVHPTMFPGWGRSVAKEETALSTTPGPHHDSLEKTTTQAWWNPFPDNWWWSNPGEKTQEPTAATRAGVTSSGSDSDDEDSSEEVVHPTMFPGWGRSVAKEETALSTTPGPHHDSLEKTTTQAWWNPFPDNWWWSNPGEKTQEPTAATRAGVTSSGSDSDDEDSSEEVVHPTMFPGWGRSVAKEETALSTTPGPHHDSLEKTTTQAWWNPFPDNWWWSNPGEKTQEPTAATRGVTSSGSDSDDEDSSEEVVHPTMFPGWGRSVAKDETAPSMTVDSQHETLLEITTQDHWNPTFTDEEEQYSSSASRALVTSENEKHQGPTQHPLLHSLHSGGISQEQNPANTTGSIELEQEFPTAGENYFGKETSTAVVPSRGAKQNDSEREPPVYPGWEQGQDYATEPAVMDRVTPSRESNHERDSTSTAAVASPDGAHHKEPTQSLLPWDHESEMSTEGSMNPTDAPGDEVLHRTTASVIKAVTASTDILAPEDITQEAWAPHLVVTSASSPEGAHHKEPTQAPLPSDDAPGQGTEGITNPTDTPRDEVLHRTTASVTKAVTESVDDADQEKATKEPLAPGTAPGREGEPANTTDGFHVHGIPGVFSDIEDRFIPLQTPLTTSSTSSVYGNQGPHKGHEESTTSPGETATTKIDSQPRSARVPDWLIIVAALVVLALILAVCIAVNSRRRCGQKKKLVINNGKGAVEDRKTSELNGDISKSQEMVHLVHKEQSNDRTQACDEFLTVNETQNHHEFDMKTGV
ncbi:CD44 antigen isoform X2 [Serinus canaria]|uniref:CD44 antigen isoform X2 n=1 Tax=Serinus canaria TaxID=9135 RepID=UPI0021CC6DD8|nr:CD44 antigen isoform X2 [Serinus canaria]